MENQTKKTKIHWGRFAGWAVLLLVALWFFTKIIHTISIFALSLLIAYLLYPLAAMISKIKMPGDTQKKIPWIPSILVAYFLVVTFVVVAVVILIPTAVDQVDNIVGETPKLAAKLQKTFNGWKVRYEKIDLPAEIKVKVEQFIDTSLAKVGDLVGKVFQTIGSVLLSFIQWLFLLIISSIIAVFLLMDRENLKRGFYSIIPPSYQDDMRDLLVDINNIFGKYVRGYSLLCLINGILTYFTLFAVVAIFRTAGYHSFPYFKYALVTCVVAGLVYFIPYLGCTLSVIVGLILSYLQMPNSLGYILLIGFTVLITNQFVDNVFRPKVLGDALGVSTLFIIFAAIAGSEILGVWGLLIGIPVGVMLVSIIRFIYRRFLSFSVSEEIMAPLSEGPTVIVASQGAHLAEPMFDEDKLRLVGLKMDQEPSRKPLLQSKITHSLDTRELPKKLVEKLEETLRGKSGDNEQDKSPDNDETREL